MNARWRFTPANSREWRGLLIFPFKVYVVLAPLCFYLWNLMAGPLPTATRVQAAQTLELGYAVCIFLLLSLGVCFLVARHFGEATTSSLWALFAYVITVLWVGARGV